MFTHENDTEYQKPRGSCLVRRSKLGKKKEEEEGGSPYSGFKCTHEVMLSGGLGASQLLVKHDSAIKVAFSQSSPPLRRGWAGRQQPKYGKRGSTSQYGAVPFPQLDTAQETHKN